METVFTYGMDQSGSFERLREHRWSGGAAGLHCVVWFWRQNFCLDVRSSTCIDEVFAFNVLSSRLERTNQDALNGSEIPTAEVEVPQACIVLIGFGGGAFCLDFRKSMCIDEVVAFNGNCLHIWNGPIRKL